MDSITCLVRYLAIAVVVMAGSIGNAASSSVTLRERQLRAIQLDSSSVNMTECSSASELEPNTIVAVCRAPGTKGAIGELHLLIVDQSAAGQGRILYKGPGVGDSYYIKVTVLDSKEGCSPIILAEAGAEFSYGIGVYVVGPGKKIYHAGEIELGAPGEDGPTSAVPFIRVKRSKKGFCFRFTRDLVRQKPDGTYATVSKDKAIYKYEGGRLVSSKFCK